MSGWRIAVRSLHAHGGGPLRSKTFDGDKISLRRARELGLVWFINGSHWQLTRNGRDFAEGRLSMNGKPMRLEVTWLSALPRPNEIRLCGAIPVEYPT